MIELRHVYKTYPGPVHALKNVDLKIEKGEFVFLTGPSGSGKSTLFKMICAFDAPTSGLVQVAGSNVATLRRGEVPLLRRQIGVVFQDFRLLSGRTVFDNVTLPLEILGERKAYIRKRVDEVLEQVGLRFKPDQIVDQLSGGEKQRVAIARALVHRPGLLVADEPTGNLDPDLSYEIMELLNSVNAHGTTVLVATHDSGLIGLFKKRRVHLQHGEFETSEGRYELDKQIS